MYKILLNKILLNCKQGVKLDLNCYDLRMIYLTFIRRKVFIDIFLIVVHRQICYIRPHTNKFLGAGILCYQQFRIWLRTFIL